MGTKLPSGGSHLNFATVDAGFSSHHVLAQAHMIPEKTFDLKFGTPLGQFSGEATGN
ncbi:MAG: hypothetical protein RL023_525 [Candidatus Parcubacteria bacterium]|jgi:hypothetical protein